MRCLSLFSGIGGIDLAAQAVGFEIVAFCEIDPFCRSILHQHWPDVLLYSDVKEVSYEQLERDGRLPIDLVYGGVPCQPASLAGKRQGSRDERWLWPQFLRVVSEVRPRWCVAENPVGILSIDARRAWGAILGALVTMGYRVGWGVWGAADVGAPHRRERVFLLAHHPGVGSHSWRAEPARQRGTPHAQRADAAVADTSGHRQWIGPRQPERESGCGGTPDVGLDGAQGYLADAPGGQRSWRAQPETRRDEVPERRDVWPDPGGCGHTVADAARREDRWRGEQGIQSDAASNRPAVANAQSGECQRSGPAWTGQSRPANDGHAVADATDARLEERAGVGCDGSEECASTFRARERGRETSAAGRSIPQCGLGGDAARISAWVDHPIFPTGPGEPPHPWEPPRTIPRGVDPSRRKRLHALGNAVVPAQIAPLFRAIAEAEQAWRVPVPDRNAPAP
ncbi:MAG: DNA (cytosine-5-)-methyltransferase [Ktedonobacteraceae bacterium]